MAVTNVKIVKTGRYVRENRPSNVDRRLTMATLGLAFPVPKRSLFGLLEQHHKSFQATSYAVQSSFRGEMLEDAIIALRREFAEIRLEVDRLKSRVRELEWHRKVEIPMKEGKLREGIISSLTKKHGGNVQERGIVTITSKSFWNDHRWFAPKNIADLTSLMYFCSKDEPDQWVCWDFGAMRVRLTHYTIWSPCLKSWVVEGSVNASSWTEIDRQWDNRAFERGWKTVSFEVANSAEFRFIRLTQTDKRHDGDDQLLLRAVEFFGILSE
jgi:hypothetical protein